MNNTDHMKTWKRSWKTNMIIFKPYSHETAVPSAEDFSRYINIYIYSLHLLTITLVESQDDSNAYKYYSIYVLLQ